MSEYIDLLKFVDIPNAADAFDQSPNAKRLVKMVLKWKILLWLDLGRKSGSPLNKMALNFVTTSELLTTNMQLLAFTHKDSI